MGVRCIRFAVCFILFLPLQGGSLHANEEYAARTGKGCSFCHQGENGGPLNPVGLAYVRNGYNYPIPERILDKSHRLSTPLHRAIRGLLGYIHLVAACIFVGAIFYVHIFIRPSRLRGGIPRGERILGLSCLSTLLVSGIYLTWYRIDAPSGFFASHFGVLLFVKLLLFALMAALGLVAVTVIHARMRREAGFGFPVAGGSAVGMDDLHLYDGTNGRPAYILYGKTVYDVTKSTRWEGGSHFRKHSAGRDLTKDLEGAPHGPEVFADLPVVAALAGDGTGGRGLSPTRKVFVVMAYANLVIVFLILACVSSWLWGFPLGYGRAHGGDAVTRGTASLPQGTGGDECLGCHRSVCPGIYHDWQRSLHAKVGISCRDCHAAVDSADVAVSVSHRTNSHIPVTVLVTPRRCGTCHRGEVQQYARSKHANTIDIIGSIDLWLLHGMNSSIERSSGCFACHGSVVAFARGEPSGGTWPNVGVGRVNPDASRGSCTSCHTRHRFSIVEARRPEACDQCHLGPDHPQIEIYNESKHGTIYHAEGDSWNWRTDDMRWLAGRDYRAPTCAVCHMSAAGDAPVTHDVTERLSWELQAPLTVRPQDFKPFPAATDWQAERAKMRGVCDQCHSGTWIDGHFGSLDEVVRSYNEEYYTPVRAALDALYAAGLLSKQSYFDEELEWDFYEFWHHEGRRARMGAAMMAPDYAWWHGFYELKHRYVAFMEGAGRLRTLGKGHRYAEFPGTFTPVTEKGGD